VVSVCIRAFDRRDELREAIASVLAQTYRDFEVVVSDDSGRLAGVVERFRDPRVRYVANPSPSGPAGNLRWVVSQARGSVLAMLNDDDWWEPRFLETCVDVLERDPRVGVVFTDQWLFVAGRCIRHRFGYAPGRHDRFVREVLEDGIPASATVLRRSAFAPVPDGVVGDFFMCIQAAGAGHAFQYVPEPLSVTRMHGRQGSWSEEGLPARMIATLAAFRFDDPACEALRRARLGEQHLIRAGRLLRRGRLREGWADLRRGRAAAAGSLSPARAGLALSGLRELLMRRAASRPRLVALAFEQWPRLRPPVLAPRARCRASRA
jgi:glycosyltransferase involved in cell wall biosynthesis